MGGAAIGAGAPRTVAQATGSVFIQKRVEMPPGSGNFPAPSPNSRFQLTLACGAAFHRQVTTDDGGEALVSGVPAGACTITEAPRVGFAFVSITVGTTRTVPSLSGPVLVFAESDPTNIGNGGHFTVAAGRTTGLRVTNAATPPLLSIFLPAGCTSQTISSPDGTPVQQVADLVQPGSALQSIWRRNPDGDFDGYFPLSGAANDLQTLNRGDVVHICVSTDAVWFQPDA